MKNTQAILRCDMCGAEFKRKLSHIGETNFCTKECANKGKAKIAYERMCKLVGGEFSEWLKKEYIDGVRSIRSISRELYGTDKCSSSILGWLSKYGIERRTGGEAVKTQWINNDERRAAQAAFIKRKITPKVREKIYKSMSTDEYKEKQRISKTGERNGMFGVTGENNPKWNPERTHDQRVRERKTFEYKNWRRNVFVRDNYKCCLCGDKRGKNLVVHHLDSYHENEQGRYDADNGITLCKTCHLEYHRGYGWKNATRQKFEAFVASRQKQTA